MRLMKARKTMTHSALISEVQTVLAHSFVADLRDLKRTIEELILKDFIRRDDTGAGLYHYVA